MNVNSIGTDPFRIYTCLRSSWLLQGLDGFTSDSIRTAGTVGLLTEGQYDYGDNSGEVGFDTIYYKPESTETFSGLYFEIPVMVDANAYGVLMTNPFTHLKDINIFGATGASVLDTSSSIGSVIDNVSAREGWASSINFKSANVIYCNVSWSRNSGATGILGQNGTGHSDNSNIGRRAVHPGGVSAGSL